MESVDDIKIRKENIVRDFVKFMQELFMLKSNDNAYVGLSGFKRKAQPVREIVRPSKTKEVKLSDLMRRA